MVDSITWFVVDLDAILKIMKIFDKFKTCASLKVNGEKVNEILKISLGQNVSLLSPIIDWSNKSIYTLGINMSVEVVPPGVNNSCEENFFIFCMCVPYNIILLTQLAQKCYM